MCPGTTLIAVAGLGQGHPAQAVARHLLCRSKTQFHLLTILFNSPGKSSESTTIRQK